MATIASFLEELAQHTRPDRAAAWDPVGLQIGDPARPVTRVAVCHEVTEAVADTVVETLPDLLVSYHPLLFRPVKRLVAGRSPAGRALRLAGAGVGLAVTHTDWDAAPGGTADALAGALGLVEAEPFGAIVGTDTIKFVFFAPEDAVESVVNAMVEEGAGRIGNYDTCTFRSSGHGSFRAGHGARPVVGSEGELNIEPEVRVEMVAPKSREGGVAAALVSTHPYEEPAFDVYDVRSNQGMIGRVGAWKGSLDHLVAVVSERLGGAGLRAAGDKERQLERVAILPGSGGSMVSAARASGADALVTGDVDHHTAVAALDGGVAIVDPGHSATEQPGMVALVDLIGGMGVDIDDLTDPGSGPWNR